MGKELLIRFPVPKDLERMFRQHQRGLPLQPANHCPPEAPVRPAADNRAADLPDLPLLYSPPGLLDLVPGSPGPIDLDLLLDAPATAAAPAAACWPLLESDPLLSAAARVAGAGDSAAWPSVQLQPEGAQASPNTPGDKAEPQVLSLWDDQRQAATTAAVAQQPSEASHVPTGGGAPEALLLFEKVLTASDVKRVSQGRVVLPRNQVESHLPGLGERKSLPLHMVQLGTGEPWTFQLKAGTFAPLARAAVGPTGIIPCSSGTTVPT